MLRGFGACSYTLFGDRLRLLIGKTGMQPSILAVSLATIAGVCRIRCDALTRGMR